MKFTSLLTATRVFINGSTTVGLHKLMYAIGSLIVGALLKHGMIVAPMY